MGGLEEIELKSVFKDMSSPQNENLKNKTINSRFKPSLFNVQE